MTYQIDPQHTTIQFKVRHMMIANVRGVFAKFSGTVDFDPSNPAASKIDLTIDATSITTPDPGRNQHLQNADFLDTANHPNFTFTSKSTSATGADSYEVTGDLTIRGITKETVLKVKNMTGEAADPWGNIRRGCVAKTRISRGAFGITFNAPINGGVLVSDEVDLTLDVELMRKP